MRPMSRLSLTLLLLLGVAVPAAAEEVVVMSAGAVEPGLRVVIEAFAASTGHRVSVTYGTAPQLTARLDANEPADVLIAPRAVVDGALRAGKVGADIVAPVGDVGVGIAMRQGAVAPAMDTPDALRDALVGASAIVFNRASTGQYIERLLAQFGIEQHVAAKVVRVDTGDEVMARIASGAPGDIGFGATTEIRMLESTGIRLVAPLPAAIQNVTTYEAAVRTGAKAPAAAQALIVFMAGPEGRALLQRAGIERSR
jgi:molybdate transport system substrate-binding protein